MAGPFLWAGNFAKSLKQRLNLSDKAYILPETVDPTVTPTDAPISSLLLLDATVSGEAYIKQDSGATTNWLKLLNTSSGDSTYLRTDGTNFMTGVLRASVGTAAAPSLTFFIDSNTGIFRATTDALGFTTGGVERFRINASGHIVPFADNTYDLGITATNRFKTGYFGTSVIVGSSTTLTTDTLSSSGHLIFQSAAASELRFNTAGANLRWKIDSSGHFLAGTDGSFDIGSSDGGTTLLRPLNAFIKTLLKVGDGTSGSRIRVHGAVTGKVEFGSAVDTDFIEVDHGAHNMNIYINGTRRLALDNGNGSVDIRNSPLRIVEGFDLHWPSENGDIGDVAANRPNNVYVKTSVVVGSTITITGSTITMGSGSITGLADPVSAQDAATKAYVDATASGLDIKKSVDMATAAALSANTAAGSGVGKTLTANANGALSVDSIAVVVNDRILVKDEVSSANNGIYDVTATGSGIAPYVLTRSTDVDQNAEVTAGMFTFVERGTVNSDSGWVLTTNDPITVDTTGLSFVQFSGAGQITAGAGLTKTGNTLDVGAGDGISVLADSVAVSLSATPGLEFSTGSLQVKVDTGIVRTAAGIGVDEPNVDHNTLANLSTGDVHTQYAFLAGRSGGQNLRGGSGAGDDLILRGTSNASDGDVFIDSSHLLFSTDNVKDIGASGATRPRTGYFGTSVIVGSSTTLTTDTLSGSGAVTLQAATANGLFFNTDGANLRWKINSAGHFLAGTDGSFDLGSADGGSTFLRPANAYIKTKLRVGDGTSASRIQIHASATAKLDFGSALDTDFLEGDSGSHVISMYVNGTKRLALDSGANAVDIRNGDLRIREAFNLKWPGEDGDIGNTATNRPNNVFVKTNLSTGNDVKASGDLRTEVAGKGLRIKEGVNARMGEATLVAGTVTVANTSVTATTRIFLSRRTLGTLAGHLSYTLSAGVSFTITSSAATDDGIITWMLVEPA